MPELPQIERKPKRMKTIAAGMLAKTVQRLGQLIELGSTCLSYKPQYGDVSQGNYNEWRLASASFLLKVLGPQNQYSKFFEGQITPST
jgi:hypothetical protein